MSGSPKQVERPTLPGIQDLFPDRDFERLRVDDSPNRAAAPNSAPPLFRLAASPHPAARPSRSPTISSRADHRPAPYPDRRPSPTVVGASSSTRRAGEVFSPHIHPPPYSHAHKTTDLPTYVLSADECPPDDDRRHGCGICHRRFNRPSSLMIHMNSHTGAQPFECPFPGCTRRFSVNSNMRRHYRNHREAAGPSAQVQPYPPAYYRTPEPPHSYYSTTMSTMSSPSSSSHSSFADGDDRADVAVRGLSDEHRAPLPPSPAAASAALSWQGRARADSDAYPPTQARPVSRPRACTVPGCNCNEAPSALRPAAFQQGSSRFSPRQR
ncbi:hypothetical protein C8Q80DRAFT_604762 [Daedaleopsis nitida]|nr:hypothetical protein C8Q80DRAFT_604762 [Daedaleopsis nitida]